MSLVQGSPNTRRRFLDRALYQADARYPVLHRDYLKALSSRNMLLKNSPVDRLALSSFDEQLADLGTQIVVLREQLIDMLRSVFTQAVESISSGLKAGISYQPKVSGTREDFLRALSSKKSLDEARGFTSVGPHADDIQIELDGKPARQFASQGQQRMIALSLKIAETAVLAQATERIPILLLDDVSSELDRERNRQLFKFLGGVGGQVFITTTHRDHILIEEDRLDLEMPPFAKASARLDPLS